MLCNRRSRLLISLTIALCSSGGASCLGYPEFQEYAEKHSGRNVNCAMCHINPDGPAGDKEGQVGSLDEKQLFRLNEARSALEPGQEVDSPILNDFGNQIIKTIGKKKFLELKSDPAGLAPLLEDSDLDKDGIADGTEFADGTDPLNMHHGDPGKLLLVNLQRFKLDLILAVIGVVCIVFGLMHLIKALNLTTKEPPSVIPRSED